MDYFVKGVRGREGGKGAASRLLQLGMDACPVSGAEEVDSSPAHPALTLIAPRLYSFTANGPPARTGGGREERPSHLNACPLLCTGRCPGPVVQRVGALPVQRVLLCALSSNQQLQIQVKKASLLSCLVDGYPPILFQFP